MNVMGPGLNGVSSVGCPGSPELRRGFPKDPMGDQRCVLTGLVHGERWCKEMSFLHDKVCGYFR